MDARLSASIERTLLSSVGGSDSKLTRRAVPGKFGNHFAGSGPWLSPSVQLGGRRLTRCRAETYTWCPENVVPRAAPAGARPLETQAARPASL